MEGSLWASARRAWTEDWAMWELRWEMKAAMSAMPDWASGCLTRRARARRGRPRALATAWGFRAGLK
jgi:hypothetical protein